MGVTLKRALSIITGVTLCLTIYLAVYMFFTITFHTSTRKKPLERWLMVADPQIQGDERVQREGLYGQIDVILNDLYFTHIMNNAYLFLHPDIVFVLGDLISRHQVGSNEFERRIERIRAIFERKDFASPSFLPAVHNFEDDRGLSSAKIIPKYSITREQAAPSKIPIVYLVGNHDIGYGGEIDPQRLHAWEEAFGASNRLILSKTGHWFAIANSQTIDTTRSPVIQKRTSNYLEHMAQVTTGDPVVLIKHIPLHKEAGFCFDEPLIITRRTDSTVMKQNFMTPAATQWLLDHLQPVMIFNGHDHEGCIYTHTSVLAKRDIPEYTVRSIMGDYSGHVLVVDVHPKAHDDLSPGKFSYHIIDIPFISTHLIVALLILWGIIVAAWILILITYPRASNENLFDATVSQVAKTE